MEAGVQLVQRLPLRQASPVSILKLILSATLQVQFDVMKYRMTEQGKNKTNTVQHNTTTYRRAMI
jgi:peptide subunit release factor RF-3